MQKKDQMHPDDMKNLILFGIISVVLWLAYDHFVLKPKMEQVRIAQVAAEKRAKTEIKTPTIVDLPRAEVVAQNQNRRLKIDSTEIIGSINLTGARIDDVSLKNYFKTIEKRENVNILSPVGTPHTRYIEHGWVVADKNINVPTSKTSWQVSGNDVLTDTNPVTLYWDNGQNIRFERKISIDVHYGFTVEQRVTNNGSASVTLFPYGLISQRDIPENFVGRFIVHEGLVGYFNKELIEKSYKKIRKVDGLNQVADTGWIGITEKDWLTALVPTQNVETKYRLTYTKNAQNKLKDKYQVDMTGLPVAVAPQSSASYKSHAFAGAKKLNLLNEYEEKWGMPHFDLAVDFGIFYFLTRPFFAVINFFYGLVGNFGVAIIMFTVVLRICVFPLANTSFRSFAKMKQISPQMAELKVEYKGNKQKLQEELIKLYQKEKVNPMAGCLPILVQIPIFFALFKVLSNTIEMRHAPFFGWIQDLSAPDPTSLFNLFGAISWTPPSFLMIGIWPCLMFVTMTFQRKLSPPPTDKLQADMMALLPLIMTFVLAKFAAGLVIYWTFNNLFSTIQQYIIMRRCGVKIDIIGNFMHWKKKKEEEPTPIEGVHVEAAMVEESIETALGVDQEDTPENHVKQISKPKPKKKNPTQKKKK